MGVAALLDVWGGRSWAGPKRGSVHAHARDGVDTTTTMQYSGFTPLFYTVVLCLRFRSAVFMIYVH